MTGNTNAWTWLGQREQYNAVSQVWYAAVERADVIGSYNDEGNAFVIMYKCFNGWTNTYYYTTTNISTKISLLGTSGGGYYETNNIDPLVRVVGGTTYANYWYVDVTDFMLYTWFAIGDSEQINGSDSILGSGSAVYIDREYESGGNYNDWFATTNAAGEHPYGFPYLSEAYCLYTNNIGFVTNLTTNTWGQITGGDAALPLNPAYIPGSTRLAQYATTGSWYEVFSRELVGGMDVGGNKVYNGDMVYPTAFYSNVGTNTNSLTVGIYGSVFDFDSNSVTGGVYESAIVTTNGVNLTNYWYDITNMTFSGSATNTNDAVYVQYTNSFFIYVDDAYYDYGAGLLQTEIMDTIYTVINMATEAGKTRVVKWDLDGATGNQVHGSGSSTSSWADAINNVTYSTNTSSGEPYSYTYGTYNGTTWQAFYRVQDTVKPVMNVQLAGNTGKGRALGANAYTIDYYLKADDPNIGVATFTNWTDDIQQYYRYKGLSGTYTYTGDFTGNVVTVTAPSWCDDPSGVVGSNASKGYIYLDFYAISLDFTNAFRFVNE